MNTVTAQGWLHRLHPAVKLGWLIWATVSVFAVTAPAFALLVAGGALLLLWQAGTKPWRMPGLRLCLTLGVVIVVLQALFHRAGEPVCGPVTREGLSVGVRVAGRLLAIVCTSALFVATTEPFHLACALMRFGLPYRWGFALVTSLRLVPLFRTEAHHVYQAQLVRGVAYDARGPRRWWLLLRHLCLPLLVSALRTAQSLSLSMEGRAFGLHPRRTFLRETPFAARDAVALVLLALAAVLTIGALWCGSLAALLGSG